MSVRQGGRSAGFPAGWRSLACGNVSFSRGPSAKPRDETNPVSWLLFPGASRPRSARVLSDSAQPPHGPRRRL